MGVGGSWEMSFILNVWIVFFFLLDIGYFLFGFCGEFEVVEGGRFSFVGGVLICVSVVVI